MKKITIACMWVAISFFYACHSSKEQKFEKIAQEITKKCPLVINEFTRLDSVVYLSQNNINRYYYTLLGAAADKQKLASQRSPMKSQLIKEINNSVEMKEYKDFNTTLEYIYYSDKTGDELLKLIITPQEYK